MPIGSEANFNGIVDLVDMKAYTYDANGKATAIDIPSDMQALVEEEREKLIENIAEADDTLLERYLEGDPISDEELKAALKKGTVARIFSPVLCGSATKAVGIDLLMDFIVNSMPSPLDRAESRNGSNGRKGNRTRAGPGCSFFSICFQDHRRPLCRSPIDISDCFRQSGIDGTFYNVNKGVKERFSQLLRLAGKEQKPIKGAGPGYIVAVAKLKDTITGDTLCVADNDRFASRSPSPR